MNILRSVGEKPQLPPTIIFNEGWLLRLVLDAFDRGRPTDHPLSFSDGATWFSEALLPTAFRPRKRTDKLSESYTHADGAIGHLEIDPSRRGYVELAPNAVQFVVIEAKMFSRLSAGVKNAPSFHQAARTVACMAELLSRSKRPAPEFETLGFYVLAPREAIDAGLFLPQMTREHIRVAVEDRVDDYGGEETKTWYVKWFAPLLERISIECLSWETILDALSLHLPAAKGELAAFYENCIKYNRPRRQP